MLVELVLLGLAIIVSPTLAWSLVRRRSAWGNWRMALLAALPLPALILVLGVVAFLVDGYYRANGCALSVCDLTRALGMTGFVIAASLYPIGLGLAWIGILLTRSAHRVTTSVDRIFE